MRYHHHEDGSIRHSKDDEVTGIAVEFIAKDVRRERTGVHAWLAIMFGPNTAGYDTFNIARDAERLRFANSCHRVLGKGSVAEGYPAVALKRDLDAFCSGLELADSRRIAAESMAGDPDTRGAVAVLDPWVFEEAGTILFAPPGRGKSWTALAFAIIADAGLAETPYGSAPTPLKTLYVNIERSRQSMVRRLSQVNEALGLDARRPLGFLNAKGKSYLDIAAAVEREVRENGYRFVVLDSISRAGFGGLNEDVTANRITDALNSLGVAWLAIGHTPRAADDHLFGSMHFEAGADVMVMLGTERDERTGNLGLALKMTKSNDAPFPRVHFVMLEFAEDGTGLASISVANAADFAALSAGFSSPIQRITDHLKETGKATASEVAEALDLHRMVVVRTLKHDSFVKLPKEGKRQPYGLRVVGAEGRVHERVQRVQGGHVPVQIPTGERVVQNTYLGNTFVNTLPEGGSEDRITCFQCQRDNMILAGFHPDSRDDAELPLCVSCNDSISANTRRGKAAHAEASA